MKICDPMNDFIDQYRDSEYRGCIGMEMAKRPNSGGVELPRIPYSLRIKLWNLLKKTKIKDFVNQFGYGRKSENKNKEKISKR